MIAANTIPHPARRRRQALAAAALAGTFVLAAPSRAQDAPKADAPPATPKTIAVAESYRVAVGDRLMVQVQDKPELSKQVDVLPEGAIYYPYVGRIDVKGLTMEELRTVMRQKLSKEVRNPDVTIQLVGRLLREASLLGKGVKVEGKRVIKEDNWRILDLIADAGGLASPPEFTSARLIRGGGTQLIEVDLSKILGETTDPAQNVLLQAGDTLIVDVLNQSRTHVQIMGAVNRQDSFPIPQDRSILTLIANAGGPTARALLSKAAIKRKEEVIPVDLSGLRQEGALKVGVKLEPGDLLFIPENKVTFSVWGTRQSGQLEWPENEKVTLLRAIQMAGGVGPEADLKKAALIRLKPDGKTETIALNLEPLFKAKKPGEAGVLGEMELKPFDAIYIEAKDPSRRKTPAFETILQTVPLFGWFLR